MILTRNHPSWVVMLMEDQVYQNVRALDVCDDNVGTLKKLLSNFEKAERESSQRQMSNSDGPKVRKENSRGGERTEAAQNSLILGKENQGTTFCIKGVKEDKVCSGGEERMTKKRTCHLRHIPKSLFTYWENEWTM